MPLNYLKPIIRKLPIAQKVGNLFLQIVSLIRPETILGVFLIAAILLAFFKISAIGFYAVFGIFTIGYFCERVTIKYGRTRKKMSDKTD